MKQISKSIILPIFIFAFMAISQLSFAADPPPPPPPGEHGGIGNKGPLDGPISGGVAVFIAFGISLAGWEIFKAYKRRKEETS